MSRYNTQVLSSIRMLCRMQNIDEKVLYERAKLILSIYREVCWSTIDRANDVCDTLICTYGDSLDGALIYLENFAPGNRFGFFPSASVGWVFTEEDWFKSNKVLDYMKLRASYGMVGNDNIGGERFFYESRWGGGGDAKFGINKGGTGNGGGLKEVCPVCCGFTYQGNVSAYRSRL